MKEVACHKKDGNLFFIKKHIPTRRKLLRKLGVRRNTYAGKVISRLYSYYFSGSINLQKEYRKYYYEEFDSLEDFIEERYNIEREFAERLSCQNFNAKIPLSRSPDSNVETLQYNTGFMDMFFTAIGGIRDEDKDRLYYE